MIHVTVDGLMDFLSWACTIALIYYGCVFFYQLPMALKFVILGGNGNESWDEYKLRKRWENTGKRMHRAAQKSLQKAHPHAPSQR
jgi:hypothetical protein